MTWQERAEALERRIRSHKAEIRRHREQLGRDKSELVSLELECSRLGIKLIFKGEGKGTHGQQSDRVAS